MFDRRVQVALDAGEGGDRVESLRSLSGGHAEYGCGQIDVFAPRQIGMESRADFEHGRQSPVDDGSAGSGRQDARDDFQEGRLACSVGPQDGDGVSGASLEADVGEKIGDFTAGAHAGFAAREKRGGSPRHSFLEGLGSVFDGVAFGQAFDLYQGIVRIHMTSASFPSTRRNDFALANERARMQKRAQEMGPRCKG